MAQSPLTPNGSSLLAYAFSKLRPEVFSHPIWVRFGRKEAPAALQISDDLYSAIKNLQAKDPSAACQILLICAVYQNYAGQQTRALKILEKAQHLAEGTGLTNETTWAMWGTCAIYLQQGNYQLAANNLMDLRAVLSNENEWILASYIDELKGYLFQPVASLQARSSQAREKPIEDLISLTLDWLLNWGYSGNSSELMDERTSGQPSSHKTGFFKWLQYVLSFENWLTTWHSIFPASHNKNKVRSTRQPLNIHSSEGDPPSTDNSKQAIEKGKSIPDPANQKESLKMGEQTDHKTQIFDQETITNSIAVHMLGKFSIAIQDLTLQMSPSRSLSLFKYLLFHHKHNSHREVLMEVFWPNADPETARNNLNVAIYSLRRSLRKVTDLSMIVYENSSYGFAPGLQVWLDVEEFELCIQAGQRFEAGEDLTAAVTEYETAISIYQGDFLEENPYDEWTVIDRERLRSAYLDMLDRLSHVYFNQERFAACITVCQLLLSRDRCREDAHCLLMRCYSRQGQNYLALRQYQLCVEALRMELEVAPAPETIELHGKVKRREFV